jgi:hypothetical protein
MEINPRKVKDAIATLLDKNEVDPQKWKDDINSGDRETRTMEFKFDTETTKDGFKLKVYYDITEVKIDITCPETLKEIEEGNMK